MEMYGKMTKIFVATFNRASDGALSKLIFKMKEENIYTDNYKEADYILAPGDRLETFDFVLKRFRENKDIIHLWAGEISKGTHDEVYRHSITLMSMMQLCTNPNAHSRVNKLFEIVGGKSNAYTVGNLMYDNLEIEEDEVPAVTYDLILYNPPTMLRESDMIIELELIEKMISGHKYIWIKPNGDKGSEIVMPYTNEDNLPRPKFLGLLKNCDRFITNSSCQYYEAPYLIKNSKNIISIGIRNSKRESKYSDMSIPNATESVMKILRSLCLQVV